MKDCFLRKEVEGYKAFYSGNAEIIRDYFINANLNIGDSNVSNNWFWKKAPAGVLKIHTGMPAAISEAMSDLLFSNGVDIKSEDRNANKFIEELIENNNLLSVFQKAAETESWSGHVAFKLVWDSDLSTTPIIEVYDILDFEVIKVIKVINKDTKKETKKKTVEILFHNYFIRMEKNKAGKEEVVKYRIDEHYGFGYIITKLYRYDKDKWIEVELSSTDDTKNIKGEVTFDADIILAVEKPNKLPNNMMPDAGIGRSDYSGIIGLVTALDEAVSGEIEDVRKGKIRRYIPLQYLPQDKNGNLLPINDFENDYLPIGDAQSKADGEGSIVIQQTDIRVDSFQKLIDQLTYMIMSRVKLSPATISIDTAGANASGLALREREKSSLRTRAFKIELWMPKIIELITKTIEMQNIFAEGSKLSTEGISVEFLDYSVPSIEERVATYSQAVTSGVSDIRTAVENIYIGKSEEDVDKIVKNIYIERGLVAVDADLTGFAEMLLLEAQNQPDDIEATDGE